MRKIGILVFSHVIAAAPSLFPTQFGHRFNLKVQLFPKLCCELCMSFPRYKSYTANLREKMLCQVSRAKHPKCFLAGKKFPFPADLFPFSSSV